MAQSAKSPVLKPSTKVLDNHRPPSSNGNHVEQDDEKDDKIVKVPVDKMVENGDHQSDEENRLAGENIINGDSPPPTQTNGNLVQENNGDEMEVKCETKESLDSLEPDDNAVDIKIGEGGDQLKKEEEETTKEVEEEIPLQDQVESDPNFAVICSFFKLFGDSLEIKPTIQLLKNMFESADKGKTSILFWFFLINFFLSFTRFD